MDREIKFKIEIDGEWHILNWKQIIDFALAGNDLSYYKKMQYVGKNDMNGKEIYDGDKVEFDNTIMECQWIEDKCMFCFVQKGWKEVHEITTENANKCQVIEN